MRILVTGAMGFLGRNLLKLLAEKHPSATMIAADLDRSFPKNLAELEERPGQLTCLPLDVRDAPACQELLRTVLPTHVVHAAAVTLPDAGALSRQRSLAVNLGGTRNLLKAATLAGSVRRVLLLSSSGLYDQSTDAAPCDEKHSLNLSTAYALTKRQAELSMAEYEEVGGFPVLAARIGPVYGEFERVRATRPRISVIQELTDRLFAKQPICVTGKQMDRDWTHARDAAKAMDLLLFSSHLNHRIYNVSTGVSVPVLDIIDLFTQRGLKVTWVDGPHLADLVLTAEQSRKPLVIERLKNDTGFVPELDIQTGIAQVIAAHERHKSALDIEEIAG